MKDLLIKAEEMTKLLNFIGELPHKYGREIEAYFNELYAARENENPTIASKPVKQTK